MLLKLLIPIIFSSERRQHDHNHWNEQYLNEIITIFFHSFFVSVVHEHPCVGWWEKQDVIPFKARHPSRQHKCMVSRIVFQELDGVLHLLKSEGLLVVLSPSWLLLLRSQAMFNVMFDERIQAVIADAEEREKLWRMMQFSIISKFTYDEWRNLKVSRQIFFPSRKYSSRAFSLSFWVFRLLHEVVGEKSMKQDIFPRSTSIWSPIRTMKKVIHLCKMEGQPVTYWAPKRQSPYVSITSPLVGTVMSMGFHWIVCICIWKQSSLLVPTYMLQHTCSSINISQLVKNHYDITVIIIITWLHSW